MTKYKVAVKTVENNLWTDIVQEQRVVNRTSSWQSVKGVEGALAESQHLPQNSGGMPDIELQVSAPGGILAAVNVSARSTSVTLYGRGPPAAYSGTIPQTRTTFQWRGAPAALRFRDEQARLTNDGIQHGNMSQVGKMKPRELYSTLAGAARQRLDVTVIIGNVAQHPPAQLQTNGGVLTFHLVPQATYTNYPAYTASLQVKPYTSRNHLETPVDL